MDTEEMYERGVTDAERGDPHPFYYQHYYHYRRGYDKTRRRLRQISLWERVTTGPGRMLLAVTLLIVVGLGLFAAFRLRAQPISPTSAAVSIPTTTSATAEPTRSPIFPTATPTPSPPTLHTGGLAVITNTEGRVLRGRHEPSLKAAASAAFKEGEQVRILEGPVEADGYTWWRVESPNGAGWSAQQSTEGVVWLQPLDG